MIFYIADMHFGHENVLRFDDRPFSEIGQMDETLKIGRASCRERV